jgi:hypothetical protein
VETGERPRHGQRKRCSDPRGKGCRGFARRGTDTCAYCGGGTRAAKRHTIDPDTGRTNTVSRGLVSVPPRVQALLDGTLDVETLDDEELARGYPRAVDGSFRNPPVVIPRAVYARLQRELFERANRNLKENLGNAAAAMTRIINNEELDPKIRLDASKWLIERVMGKQPDITVNVDEKRFEKLFERLDRTGGYGSGESGMYGDIVEGEVVDDGREP